MLVGALGVQKGASDSQCWGSHGCEPPNLSVENLGLRSFEEHQALLTTGSSLCMDEAVLNTAICEPFACLSVCLSFYLSLSIYLFI